MRNLQYGGTCVRIAIGSSSSDRHFWPPDYTVMISLLHIKSSLRFLQARDYGRLRCNAGVVNDCNGISRFTCSCRASENIQQGFLTCKEDSGLQITHLPAMQVTSKAWISTEQSIPGMFRPTQPPQDSMSFMVSTHCPAISYRQSPLPWNVQTVD